MKKLFALMLAVLMLFALAACGGKLPVPSDGGSDIPDNTKQEEKTENKGWPTISYLQDGDKYTGDGKITQVHEWDASGENEMWTIYYSDATFASVENYVAGLVSAGWTNHYADEDGNYMEDKTDKGTARSYYCTCDYAEVEITVADFSNSMNFTESEKFRAAGSFRDSCILVIVLF